MDEKDAYICYNSADLEWVLELAQQLESETIDGTSSGRPLKVFFDRWDMDFGDSLIDKMNEGMKKSRHVVAVLSPEFLSADWPRFEWKHIVADDPNNTRGRLIPILLRDLSLDEERRIEFPAPFKDLKYLDFRGKSQYKIQIGELVRKIRGLPSTRGKKRAAVAPLSAVLPGASESGSSWSPDVAQELLLSNLLHVIRAPKDIWGIRTNQKDKKMIWEQSPSAPPFILKEGHLFTFADLGEDPETFKPYTTGSPVKVSVNDWARNEDKMKWLIQLFNVCLRGTLYKRRIRCDEKGRFFFLPNELGEDRKLKTLGFQRTVAKRIESSDGESEFWVHHSARLKFKRLGDKLFLQVEPSYFFTEDGFNSIRGKSAGKLSQMWTGKQQNSHILRDVLFWGDVLADRLTKIKIFTGGVPIKIEPLPAATSCNRGIKFDEIRIKTLVKPREDELERVANQIEDLQDEVDDISL